LAGDGLAATNSAAVSVDTCREGELGGGDCERPGSILRTRGKRKAWGRFGTHRRSRGQHRTAAEGDGHGGGCGVLCGTCTGKRERVSPREKGKEGGLRGIVEQIQGSFSVAWVASRR
jgi:hypothetical protein